MELKLNIYSDCTSEKPTKTYVIRRITFKAAKTLLSLQETKEEDSTKTTLEMIRAVCPDFDEKDIDGVDPVELGQVFKALGNEITNVVAKAQKNS